jgi:hypothetical protein
MVRLGYERCSACHLSPQGGGLLTDYGKGIDDAQSLIRKEYQPADPLQPSPLRYDIRLLTSGSWTTAAPSGTRPTPPSWLRPYFRAWGALGAHNRLASTVFFETPPGDPRRLWDSKPVINFLGAWEYRQSDGFTLAVAHDRIPRGVEMGQTRTILQDGENDRFPTQLRAFFTAKRFHTTTYVYGPGSSNAWDRRSYGSGALGEVHFLQSHLVMGVSAARAVEQSLISQRTGAYTRLGFGKVGVLAEHELTHQATKVAQPAATNRYAGYTQLFFAPKEWLVTSLIGEQSKDLSTNGGVFRWRPEVQARLSSSITVTAGVRTDSRQGTRGTSRLYSVQLALKSVQ